GAVNKACLVASGEFVGNLQVSAKNYDIAAAHIIVEEAGGKVTGYDGRELDYSRPFRSAIISNGLVHEKLMECIKE
ncbi:MAG TPA: inositol monophosphatase family protein, partial [Candidatus Paceibacterota bacterium]|nr:inositol monophosphatase family protein [Candidatus Paceibacterota bacterium]